jgi:hypothetical protein
VNANPITPIIPKAALAGPIAPIAPQKPATTVATVTTQTVDVGRTAPIVIPRIAPAACAPTSATRTR